METKTFDLKAWVNENPDAPASKRQTFALYCATKHDYRDENLTRKEAFDLLQELNHKNGGYVKKQKEVTERFSFIEMKDFLNSKKDKFVELFARETKIVSGIVDDINPNGKKYIMIGTGCGFASVTIKRLRQSTKDDIQKKWRTVEEAFKVDFEKSIPVEFREKLKKIGNPLGAILAQNVNINAFFANRLAEFLHAKGVDVSVKVWDD